MTTRLVVVSVLLMTLVFAGSAPAGVDTEVTGKAKVKSTVNPSGETETFRLDATAGTLLTITLKRKTGNLDLAVEVRDPTAGTLDLGTASRVSDTGSAISVKKLPLPVTGAYSILVTAVGTGDYQMKIKAAPRGNWGETVTIAAGEDRIVAFSCPEGSSIKLKAKAGKGSDAEPRFGDLDGSDVSTLGSFKTNQHKVKLTGVSGGDHELSVDNLGATGGDVKVTITVSPPAVTKDNLDFRGTTLGTAAGGESVLGRTVGAFGAILAVADPSVDLDGAGVTVPAGALGQDIRVILSSTTAPDLPDPDATLLAGPTLLVDAGDASFALPLLVTLPYDPTLVPADRDPTTDLRVLRVSDSGATSVLTPVAGGVDTTNDLVTVQTQGFSKFAPFSPKGAPNLSGRSYWHLFLEFQFETGPGNDSRVREVYLGKGSVTLGDSNTPKSFSYLGTDDWMRVDTGDNVAAFEADSTGMTQPWLTGSVTSGVGSASFPDGTWKYDAGGQTITVKIEDDDEMTYWMSADGSILVSDGEPDDDDPNGFIDIAIEKHPTATKASVAGSYYVGEVEISAWAPPGGPGHLAFYRSFGNLTLKSDGTFTYGATEKDAEWDAMDQQWQYEDAGGSISGTFTVSGGKITLSFLDDGDPSSFEFMVGVGGEVLLGGKLENDGTWAAALAIIGTKQGSKLDEKTCKGDYEAVALEFSPHRYDVTFGHYEFDQFGNPTNLLYESTLSAADWTFNQLGEDWSFDGSSKLSLTGGPEKAVYRDTGETGGLAVDNGTSDSVTLKYEVNSKGRLKAWNSTEWFVGGTTSSGLFSWLVDDPEENIRVWGLYFQVRTPPAKP
jgi:pre-peptidase